MIKKNQQESIYFVGIKGVAMTALALYLKEMGYDVAGSDTADIFPTDAILESSAIPVLVGFSENNIPNHCTGLIYTGAHGGRNNPEVRTAMSRGIPCLPHGRALGKYMKKHRGISIAGCHGKTTTSAMTSKLLVYAKQDPSYAIGCGSITDMGNPGHFGHGKWFIAEADEYMTDPNVDSTPRFYWQKSEIFVVTNIDFDHPDVYENLEHVQKTFYSYINKNSVLKTLILNADDPPSAMLADARGSGVELLTYGRSSDANYRITDIESRNGKTSWKALFDGKSIGQFHIQVPGTHNVYNAAAAMLAGFSTGLDWNILSAGIQTFRGTKRRFEFIGKSEMTSFYDDYAHHPTEIRATLAAIRQWHPDSKIVAVFQPHTFSRTKSLLPEFVASFSDVDTILITDIYGSAREVDPGNLTGKTIIDAMNHTHAVSTPTAEDVIAAIQQLSYTPDIILFLGAGDIYNWEKHVVSVLGGILV